MLSSCFSIILGKSLLKALVGFYVIWYTCTMAILWSLPLKAWLEWGTFDNENALKTMA